MRESPRPANRRKVCLSVPAADSLGFFSHGAVASFADHIGPLRQAQHIQDERYFAVAHDARSGKSLDRFELLAQRLNHDFLGVVDLIDDQPELPVISLQDHDVDGSVVSVLVASAG